MRCLLDPTLEGAIDGRENGPRLRRVWTASDPECNHPRGKPSPCEGPVQPTRCGAHQGCEAGQEGPPQSYRRDVTSEISPGEVSQKKSHLSPPQEECGLGCVGAFPQLPRKRQEHDLAPARGANPGFIAAPRLATSPWAFSPEARADSPLQRIVMIWRSRLELSKQTDSGLRACLRLGASRPAILWGVDPRLLKAVFLIRP
jgi:hypothetical protein